MIILGALGKIEEEGVERKSVSLHNISYGSTEAGIDL